MLNYTICNIAIYISQFITMNRINIIAIAITVNALHYFMGLSIYSPCSTGDKSLPGKEPLGVMKFGRFSFFASYLQVWEIYLNIKEIYQLKVTKENRKSAKLHYSQWLISWQRFVLHMLRMWHGDRQASPVWDNRMQLDCWFLGCAVVHPPHHSSLFVCLKFVWNVHQILTYFTFTWHFFFIEDRLRKSVVE